jgi:hypothetical protein
LQDLIPRSKGLLASLIQNEDLINCGKGAGSVSDNNGDTTAGPDTKYRCGQCLFALGI